MPSVCKVLLLLGFMGLLVGPGWTCNDPKYVQFKDLNHVMCQSPPSNGCPNRKPDSIVRGLNEHEKTALIYLMNEFRSSLATGKIPGFHPAANMPQLTWDDELATLAQKSLEFCSGGTDYDARVERFEVRQIPLEIVSVPDSSDDAMILDFANQMLQAPYDSLYMAKQIGRYSEEHNGWKSSARSFTQLIWDRTKYVGCGYIHYIDVSSGQATRKVACNFGPRGNLANSTVYEIGEPDCERESSVFPGLCVTDEAEDKFVPLKCSDDAFKVHLSVLCGPKEELYKTLGRRLYDHIYCWKPWYRRKVRQDLVNLNISIFAWVSWLCCIVFVHIFFPIKIFLV